MAKRTLGPKLVEQCFRSRKSFLILVGLFEDLPIATLDLCFGKQNTPLGDCREKRWAVFLGTLATPTRKPTRNTYIKLYCQMLSVQ